MNFSFLLPDLDSNQDNQIQKLRYYPYTIRQWAAKIMVLMIFSAFDAILFLGP